MDAIPQSPSTVMYGVAPVREGTIDEAGALSSGDSRQSSVKSTVES